MQNKIVPWLTIILRVYLPPGRTGAWCAGDRKRDLYARLVLPLVMLTLLAWALHPHACCPQELQVTQPAGCACGQRLESPGSPADPGQNRGCRALSLAGADSKLGETMAAFSQAYLGALMLPGVPDIESSRSSPLYEQIQPKRLFVSIIEHPPRT